MQNSGITEIFQFHNHIRVCFVLFIYLFHNFYIFFRGGGVDGVFVEHNQNLRWFFFIFILSTIQITITLNLTDVQHNYKVKE